MEVWDELSTQPPLGTASEDTPAQLLCLGELGGLGPKLLSPRKSCCCQSFYGASKEKVCNGGSVLISTVRTRQAWGPLAQGCLGPANWAAKWGSPHPKKNLDSRTQEARASKRWAVTPKWPFWWAYPAGSYCPASYAAGAGLSLLGWPLSTTSCTVLAEFGAL